MTETQQPPADEAVQQARTTALPTENPIDHGMFVPQSTRDNYLQIIRDTAATRGQDPGDVRDELVEQFRGLHDRQPLDGYDHLGAWLQTADVGAGSGTTGMQELIGRTLESARRDPQQAVQGDQSLVEVGVARQLQADELAAAAAVAPALDPSFGMLPNAGPLPVPEGTTVAPPEVAEQQAAALAQVDAEGKQTDESKKQQEAATTPEPSPSPSPSAGKGKSGGSSDTPSS